MYTVRMTDTKFNLKLREIFIRILRAILVLVIIVLMLHFVFQKIAIEMFGDVCAGLSANECSNPVGTPFTLAPTSGG